MKIAATGVSADSCWRGCRGQHQGPGRDHQARRCRRRSSRRARSRRRPRRCRRWPRAAPPAKQILFGDLHVHTTFSPDAFMRSLPMLQGEGAHPPADACDFARYCSALDFWSINDHAEGDLAAALAGDQGVDPPVQRRRRRPEESRLVAFLGWEWTQVGADAGGPLRPQERHLPRHRRGQGADAADQRAQPAAGRRAAHAAAAVAAPRSCRSSTSSNRQRYFDFGKYQQELRDTPMCPRASTRASCPPTATSRRRRPRSCSRSSSQWGFDTIVIPHGTTWGLYTPPGTDLGQAAQPAPCTTPSKQTLIEVYSGHGNSEEYRDWHDVVFDANGQADLPRADRRLPALLLAGRRDHPRALRQTRRPTSASSASQTARTQLPRRRRRRAPDRARRDDRGLEGLRPVPRLLQPGLQHAARRTRCSTSRRSPTSTTRGAPRRFRFGFIGSSDNHTARPGTGYKEFARRMMTEAAGPRDATWARAHVRPPDASRAAESVPLRSRRRRACSGFQLRRPRAPGVVLHDRRPRRRALPRAATATRSGTR